MQKQVPCRARRWRNCFQQVCIATFPGVKSFVEGVLETLQTANEQPAQEAIGRFGVCWVMQA